MKKLLVLGQAQPEPRLTAGLRGALTSTVGSRVSTLDDEHHHQQGHLLAPFGEHTRGPVVRSRQQSLRDALRPVGRELGPVTRCPMPTPHAERTH